MSDTPRSEIFDDIYFSPEDGLAESEHVFLHGNTLPQAFKNKSEFTIAETGFGTGLNFLGAWKLFEETAEKDSRLQYISFEKYPLSGDEILKALQKWAGHFEGRLERLIALYPLRIPGWHKIILGDRVHLTLIFEDINAAITHLHVPVDAWFLDGFAPAKNPDMWSDLLFEVMAANVSRETSFATFTAAGFVKRGLQEAGFSVEKVQGYGRKREMLTGRKSGTLVAGHMKKKVAIIGGGLAGTSCGYILKKHGHHSVIFEESDVLAAGASGNPVGIYNPRLSMHRTPDSEFYMSAFALCIRELTSLHDVDYFPCGSLHLMSDGDKRKRMLSMIAHWQWPQEHARIVTARETSEITGIPVEHDAVYIPESGSVSPQKLCVAYARGLECRLGTSVSKLRHDGGVWHINGESFDSLILACGPKVLDMEVSQWLPLETVRGQIVQANAHPQTQNLKCNICYGGYLSAPFNGRHTIGSTFQKWLKETDVLDSDSDEILQKLADAVPSLTGILSAASARASLRVAANDRMPVIGSMPQENLYISAAHGSHGIVSSIMAAHMIAAELSGKPSFVAPEALYQAVSPKRFIERASRKGINLLASADNKERAK